MKDPKLAKLACDSLDDQRLLFSDSIVQIGFFGILFILNIILFVYAIKGRQTKGIVIYLLGGLLTGEIAYILQGTFFLLAFNLVFPKGSNTCE
jgi:hypothetical protein